MISGSGRSTTLDYSSSSTRRLVFGHAVDEVGEEVCPLEVGLRGGVVALPPQDRDELRSGLEEAATLTDRLVRAVELSRADAVPVRELTAVSGPVLAVVVRGHDDADALDCLDRSEVLVGDRVIGDPGVDEGHPR